MTDFNPAAIRLQIDQLLAAFPDLLEDEILHVDMLEGQTDMKEFLRMIERKRQEADAMVEAQSIVIRDLSARKSRYERRDEALRKLMFDMLQWAQLPKLEMPEATLSIRQGTPKVVIVDETKLPKSMWRVIKEIDKVKIREALTNKKNVAGAVMSNGEPTLAIRVR